MKYLKGYTHMIKESEYTDHLLKLISQLTEEDKEFLMQYGEPVIRKFMGTEELKKCNKYVKMGVMIKGHTPDSRGSVQYYVDSFILNRL